MTTPSELLAIYSNQTQVSEFFVDKLGIISILSYSNGKSIYDGTKSVVQSLTDAINEIPESGGYIFFPSTKNGGTYVIDSDITIPSNVTLWFAPGAKLKITNGAIVTLNCCIEAGIYQIFDNDGTGRFVGNHKIEKGVYVEWFGAVGDGQTDDSVAIQDALNSGYEVVFNNKVYALTEKITITNKRVRFNGCTLKRIGSNMTILDFSNSSNMAIEDVNITDVAGTKGTMVIGTDCYNVTIKNLSVVCNSSHETSNSSWAVMLSGERFLIDGLYIDSYNYGYWADGIHFAYVVDSIINNFKIYSGDDCIAITQHEEGGTGSLRNITSKNNIFTNGVLYSKNASAIRLGFDNSGLRTTNEINNIYCEDSKFDNILVVAKYFIRDEYLGHDTAAIPNNSKRITFSNIVFKLKDHIEGTYLPIHISDVYAWEGFKFTNCDFYTFGTMLFCSVGESINGKIYFSDCHFDIKYFSPNTINTSLNFSKCNIKYDYDNSCIVTSKDLTITDSVINNDGTGAFARVSNDNAIIMINNVKSNKRIIASNSTKLGIATNVYSGDTRYDSVCKLQLYNGVFSDKIVNSQNNIYYIPESGSISFNFTKYNILALTPLYERNKLYSVYYYYDTTIQHSFDSDSELSTHLSEDGLSITFDFSSTTLTISNTLPSINLVEIRMFSQIN